MYEFYDNKGVEYVRIGVGNDVIAREATKEDHEAADAANAAEKAAAEALEAATKERMEREHANEQLALGLEPKAVPASSQKQIEQEFDAGLAHELDDDNGNGKHKRGRGAK